MKENRITCEGNRIVEWNEGEVNKNKPLMRGQS